MAETKCQCGRPLVLSIGCGSHGFSQVAPETPDEALALARRHAAYDTSVQDDGIDRYRFSLLHVLARLDHPEKFAHAPAVRCGIWPDCRGVTGECANANGCPAPTVPHPETPGVGPEIGLEECFRMLQNRTQQVIDLEDEVARLRSTFPQHDARVYTNAPCGDKAEHRSHVVNGVRCPGVCAPQHDAPDFDAWMIDGEGFEKRASYTLRDLRAAWDAAFATKIHFSAALSKAWQNVRECAYRYVQRTDSNIPLTAFEKDVTALNAALASHPVHHNASEKCDHGKTGFDPPCSECIKSQGGDYEGARRFEERYRAFGGAPVHHDARRRFTRAEKNALMYVIEGRDWGALKTGYPEEVKTLVRMWNEAGGAQLDERFARDVAPHIAALPVHHDADALAERIKKYLESDEPEADCEYLDLLAEAYDALRSRVQNIAEIPEASGVVFHDADALAADLRGVADAIWQAAESGEKTVAKVAVGRLHEIAEQVRALRSKADPPHDENCPANWGSSTCNCRSKADHK